MECSFVCHDWRHDAAGRLYAARDIIYKAVLHGSNYILFTRGNDCKKIKIDDCGSDYIYKIQKARILAQGGAAGLLTFFNNPDNTSFFITVINRVFDYMNGGAKI